MATDDLPHETFDAADPAAEANAKRDAARIARQSADVMRGIMISKPGRAWLLRLLDSCHINNTPDFGEETHRQSRALGREDVGKEILLAAMSASTDLYMKAIKEAQEEEARLAEVRRTERKNRDERDGPVDVKAMVADLPPPAGYPGGPPLRKKKDT